MNIFISIIHKLLLTEFSDLSKVYIHSTSTYWHNKVECTHSTMITLIKSFEIASLWAEHHCTSFPCSSSKNKYLKKSSYSNWKTQSSTSPTHTFSKLQIFFPFVHYTIDTSKSWQMRSLWKIKDLCLGT